MSNVNDDPGIPEEVIEAMRPLRLRFQPIPYNGQSYDSMVLREPTGDELLKAGELKNPFEQTFALIAAVTGLPAIVVRKLPQRVIERVGEYFAPFTPPSPENAGAA
ncbi:hypothetical protein HMPREF9946_03988 [Acetobacteraceae bacterium AT-5844]|nr:hypothetical protein HMPREF9946_03988 [Acetobacteraceae bacterium AT-5844]